ncbi:aspartate-semialdehyde dehydrogenase [Protofrankia coriariae]|uniref:aspartate-semialdehyde dehydrogenase n=1 Tax=Protofrankia coriariae TaxID=1562887 RepID=UPI000AF5BBA2|nr:aspartate-semialdehyde dehydrogenase [Protofrankia coriariae]
MAALTELYTVDDNYRLVWEFGIGLNTALRQQPGNCGMNEMYGAGNGVVHLGFGLTPTTRYALTFTPAGVDAAVFSAGAPISRQWAPTVGAAGALVVDNSSAFRMDDDVPLVVPEVNPDARATRPARNIVANPNCSTIQLVRALHPLRSLGTLEWVVLSTYQSGSGGGLRGLEELAASTRAVLDGLPPATSPSRFGHPLAFNLVPEIGLRDDDGISHEEQKLRREPRKILTMPSLRITATAVRVPVINGHSEAVHLGFDRPVSPADAIAALRGAPNLRVYGADDGYPMPRPVCESPTQRRLVHVGRVRSDPDDPRSLWLWVVADNLIVGTALNALEIVRLATGTTWLTRR